MTTILLNLALSIHLKVGGLTHIILDQYLRYKSSSTEKPVYVGTCRSAPEGCQVRIHRLVNLIYFGSLVHGVDPYLAIAVAMSESHLNPRAQGSQGEVGIFQIHPSRREAPAFRKYLDTVDCNKDTFECQEPVVHIALGILKRSVQRCGTEILALGMYNSGVCKETSYALKIIRLREKLADHVRSL